MPDVVEPHASTQVVLYAAGLSVVVVVVWVATCLIRIIRGVASRSTATAGHGKRGKAPVAAVAAPAPAAAQTGSRGAGASKADLKKLIKESQNAKKSAATKEDMAAHHALFLATLKGHGDSINGIAWSHDASRLASACDDMTLRVFDLTSLGQPGGKEPKFKAAPTRQGPLGVGFGNDGDSLVVALRGYPDINLAQLSPHRRSKAGPLTWETDWSRDGALSRGETLLSMVVVPAPQAASLGAAHGGGVAVLLSQKREGRVFGLAGGAQLGTFEPNSFANHGLAVSADGRFIAVASFTADVKVWEVSWGRDGFKGVSKAMDLKGHSSQVMSAAFAPDGSKAVTASKDGTLRVWNTAVRYALQEDPKVLLKTALPLPAGQVFERLALGPDGTIAAALGGRITFLDGASGKVLEELHAHDGNITGLAWAPKRLPLPGSEEPVAVLASCSSDRRVRIWRSPAAAR